MEKLGSNPNRLKEPPTLFFKESKPGPKGSLQNKDHNNIGLSTHNSALNFIFCVCGLGFN
jgi:hypothetical protein